MKPGRITIKTVANKREILGKLSFDPMGIASHSLKATLLSMCAKFGMEIEIRKILGYHAVKDAGSAFVYARDKLVHPLRMLDAMLRAIRSGEFAPDAPRSKMFPSKPVPVKLANNQDVQMHEASARSRSTEDEPLMLQDIPDVDVMVLPSMRANHVRASLLEENDNWDSDSSSEPEEDDERTVDFIDEANTLKAAQTSGEAKKGECSGWPGPSDMWWRHTARMMLHLASEHERSNFARLKKISAAYAEMEKPKMVLPSARPAV